MYWSAEFVAEVPYGVVTMTSTVPAAPAGAVTVTWSSTAGAQYTVERSADLGATAWTSLTTNLAATGASTSYTDSTLPANTARMFYRIKQN